MLVPFHVLQDTSGKSNKKRPGSCTIQEKSSKKSKKSADSITCPGNLASLGAQDVGASQKAVDASANNVLPFLNSGQHGCCLIWTGLG